MTRTHTTIETAIGELTLVAEHGALAGVYFPGHWTRPERATFGARSAGGGVFAEADRQLTAYLAGRRTSFELPTALAGDGFQRRVWERLASIPYGETTTYGEIARELGDATLARAVGGAVAHNPLSIVVPCHRVVGQRGRLTGYAGGLERKRWLLELEGAAAVAGQLELPAVSEPGTVFAATAWPGSPQRERAAPTGSSSATSASAAWGGTTRTGHGAWSTR